MDLKIKQFNEEIYLMQKVQLKDILYLQNGYAFKSNCFNLENTGIPLIRISNIHHLKKK